MKNFNMLIDKIESQTLSYEMLHDLGNLSKFLLIYDKKINKLYKNLALDVIISFLDMTKPIKSLIYSKAYYYEDFIYLYLMLKKYEPRRREVKELNNFLVRLSESKIIKGSEMVISQEASLTILKEKDLKIYSEYYEERISSFLENPLILRPFSYSDIILCLILQVKNIEEYMRKNLEAYYYFGRKLEYLLCLAVVGTEQKVCYSDCFTGLFIKTIIEEERNVKYNRKKTY